MHRHATIDLCRGLLFILMMNTHALTIAGVAKTHWLFSDFWLPNGWATVVFVVLSGYGVGFIFSVREPLKRDKALRRRGAVILAVMFASNVIFAILKLITAGNLSPIFDFEWWLGFITLKTEWTISGVLLPTGLVLFCGPAMIRWTQKVPWLVLTMLTISRFAVSILALHFGASAHAETWAIRFFLLDGFGGFPVLPFVVNGCIGIWLGVQHNNNETVWRRAMAILLLFQLIVYFSTFMPPITWLKHVISSVGAIGKFAWMLLIAHFLATSIFRPFTPPIELLGRFSLGSFVMHRVFLQALAIIILNLGLMKIQVELRAIMLFLGTFVLTWALCKLRQQFFRIDALFRGIGL